MEKGLKFLSELKLHTDYFKWREEDNRYENWNEACEDIIRGHAKRYKNCVGVLFNKNDYFQKCFHVLLSGCGLDFSLRKKFVEQLSPIYKRTLGAKTHVIEDSIEGWADALGVLMSSYLGDNQPFPEYTGYEIKFDYSLIRLKGAKISGGFRAPGPEGLKQSLERIESLLEKWITTEGVF